VVLLAVGLYLIALGFVGEGMKYLGETFQRSLAIIFALVAGLGFLTILLSETIKRKIAVFLNRNFYRDKFDYRSQWLLFTARLSTAKSGEGLLAGILSGYCETFGMGCGALFLGNNAADNYSLAAGIETNPASRSFSLNDALVAEMLENRRVINVNDLPLRHGNEMDDYLTGNEGSFVVPLFLDDRLEGFILLGRPLNKHETYGIEDYDLMMTLASQTSSAILNLRLSDQLAQAKEMEVLGKVSAFVVHDLKNLVYTISLILDNARDFIAEPEFQHDMLASLDNTVAKMKTLIAKLKYLPEKKGLQKEPADLLQLVRETAATITGVTVNVEGDPVVAMVDRDEIHKVTLNLLVNAVDATDTKGPVRVEVGGDKNIFIRVSDEGCGIPEEYLRHHLFSPFKSTKKSGLGIGLYQCKQIVEAHDGSIEVESTVGRGTVFTVRLPGVS